MKGTGGSSGKSWREELGDECDQDMLYPPTQSTKNKFKKKSESMLPV